MALQGTGPFVVGIDLGGTKILAGVVAADHTILGRSKRATPAKEGGPAIVQTIIECVDDALQEAGLDRSDVVAAGIGSPGPLDPETGVIRFSANLNVRNFPLGPNISSILDKPVLVRNDVRVGGYGEFRLGAGRGYQNIINFFVGTGIGGCLIHEGKILEGSTGNAGEVGHMIVKSGGPKCGCGAHGCVEALASKTAIARRISKAIQKGKSTILVEKLGKKSGRLKSGDLAEAVSRGDHVAIHEVHRAAHYLGVGLSNLANVLGPELIIIGGGIAGALGEPYVNLVRESARRHMLTDPDGKIKIVRAALGDDAGILGASLFAREQFIEASTAPPEGL